LRQVDLGTSVCVCVCVCVCVRSMGTHCMTVFSHPAHSGSNSSQKKRKVGTMKLWSSRNRTPLWWASLSQGSLDI